MRGIKRVKNGFSLIEIVISVAILVILMIPIASVTIATVKRNAESEQKQRASFVGQKLLEELKSYDTMTKVSTVGSNDVVLSNGNTLQASLGVIGEYISVTNDPNFTVSDAKGSFTTKVTLTKNLDTTYSKPSTDVINNDDYKQKIYLFTDSTAKDYFTLAEDANGDAVGDKKYIDGVAPIDLSAILVLKIDGDMAINIAKRSGVIDTLLLNPDKPAESIPDDTKNKILIKIDKDFRKGSILDKKLNLYVDSIFDDVITIDVLNEDKPDGKIEVFTSINNNVSIKKTVTIKNNLSTYQAKTLGDIYTIKVEVFKQDSTLLFSGEATKNILLQ